MPRKRRIKTINSPGFGITEVKQSFNDADQAKKLLDKITTDEAILKVMEKHNWKVSKVIEITPKSHPSLWGYKENRGKKVLDFWFPPFFQNCFFRELHFEKNLR